MEQRNEKQVAVWLLIGVAMIMVQILLGGITRLTGSGLSITDWNPIMGVLPPLNHEEWSIAFSKYKQLGQYQFVNSDFTLSDFKFIFFWEWLHRLWARLLGVVFAVGFIFFLVKGYFDRKMVVPFIILFFLGGVQGLIGWIMVKSGLNPDDIHVNHVKLAWHFMAALFLLCYTLWFALQLWVPQSQKTEHKSLQFFTIFLIILLGVQLVFGSFMAGLKAAPAASSWPLINGSWFPETLKTASWVNNPINVQFWHRMLAYLLCFFIAIWFAFSGKKVLNKRVELLSKFRFYPVLLGFLQALLGVSAIMLSPRMATSCFGSFEIVALMHQMVAMLLLISLVVCLYLLSKKRPA